jgi:hypothetical protein
MARFSRIDVFNQMASTGLVPLFYHADVELGKNILKACYEGVQEYWNLPTVVTMRMKFSQS